MVSFRLTRRWKRPTGLSRLLAWEQWLVILRQADRLAVGL